MVHQETLQQLKVSYLSIPARITIAPDAQGRYVLHDLTFTVPLQPGADLAKQSLGFRLTDHYLLTKGYEVASYYIYFDKDVLADDSSYSSAVSIKTRLPNQRHWPLHRERRHRTSRHCATPDLRTLDPAIVCPPGALVKPPPDDLHRCNTNHRIVDRVVCAK